jgi:hypothetical protein
MELNKKTSIMGAELYAVYKEYNDISGGLFNGW